MAEFLRYHATRIYVLEHVSEHAVGCVFIPASTERLPPVLRVDQAAEQPGSFVFLAWPDNPEALDDSLRAAELDCRYRDARITWLGSGASVHYPAAVGVRIQHRDGATRLAELARIRFAQLSLCLAGGSQVTPDPEGGLILVPPASIQHTIAISPRGNEARRVIPIAGAVTLQLGPAARVGQLVFDLDLDSADLDALAGGLHYVLPALTPAHAGYASPLAYPVFDLSGEPDTGYDATAPGSRTLQVQARFSPLQRTDPGAHGLRFKADHPPVLSHFRTVLGHAVTLRPGVEAGWVFERWQHALPPEDPVSDQAAFRSASPWYLAPAGRFLAEVAGPARAAAHVRRSGAVDLRHNLLCGLSGLEYVGSALNAPPARFELEFQPGQAAYSAAQWTHTEPDDPLSSSDRATPRRLTLAPLSPLARTSWLHVRDRERAPITYYSQPDTSVLYENDPDTGDATLGAEIMRFLELPVRTVAAEPPRFVPMAPYAGVSAAALWPAVELEQQVLMPTRQRLVHGVDPGDEAGSQRSASQPLALAGRAAGDRPVEGITPQGLRLTLDASRTRWRSLALAHFTPGDAGAQALRLTNVSGPLKAAMQSSQVFCVLSDPTRLLRHASVPHALDAADLAALGRDDTLPEPVLDALVGRRWESADALRRDLERAPGTLTPEQIEAVVARTAAFFLWVDGWSFDLSPYRWQENGTLAILKFDDERMIDHLLSQAAWTREDELTAPGTRQRLQQWAQNIDALRSNPAYQPLLQILHDPHWTGILFFDAPLSADGHPPELAALTAGLDMDDLVADHLGINVTPIGNENGALVVEDSSIFALLRYIGRGPAVDPETTQYEFAITRLFARWQNSKLVDFSATAGVWLGELFGEPTELYLPEGDALVPLYEPVLTLEGVAQRHDDAVSYQFTTETPHRFFLASQVLSHVDIDRAGLLTEEPPGTDGSGLIRARLSLHGDAHFFALPEFDALGFGHPVTPGESRATPTPRAGLRLSGLALDMTFSRFDSEQRSFDFHLRDTAVDLTRSVARADSLHARFPVELIGFGQRAADQGPHDPGHVDVATPLAGAAAGKGAFYLSYRLDLGSTGALGDDLRFRPDLSIAWSPHASDYAVSCGIRLPGPSGKVREVSLQKFLRLSFGDIELARYGKSYMLIMRGMAVKILGISLPPGGQTNLFIFGDPTGEKPDVAGWYGVFAKPQETDEGRERL